MEMPRLRGDCEGLRMICTEAEAREKWCPKYQVAQLFNDLISNRANFGDDCRCIGSDCMMWRWRESEPMCLCLVAEDPDAEAEPPRPDGVPASWIWVPESEASYGVPHWHEPHEEAKARRRGVCGLGGKP